MNSSTERIIKKIQEGCKKLAEEARKSNIKYPSYQESERQKIVEYLSGSILENPLQQYN